MEQLMHKNKLQEYTQKLAISYPEYQTVNEGFVHAPEFRSSVKVDNTTYTSPNKFSQRKAAEQDVARLAFESISRKIEDEGPEGCSLTDEITTCCKSILNEFAQKRKLEKPTYTTQKLEGNLPIFASSVVLGDQLYTGSVGKNKKEAERSAARTAIQIILDSSGTDTSLLMIIRSKTRLLGAQERETSKGNVVPVLDQHINERLDVLSNSMLGSGSGSQSGSDVQSIIGNQIYTESTIVHPSLGDHNGQGIVGDVANEVQDIREKCKRRKIHDEQLFLMRSF